MAAIPDTRLPWEPIPFTAMADIAVGIGAAEPLWRSAVCPHDRRRQPVRLLATPRYEVWVIGWTPAQGVELHDHGESAGLFVVTEGALTDLELRDGRLVPSRVGIGEHRQLPLGIIHDVTNTAMANATSIHVYSPPLRTMMHYDPATYRPTWTERIVGEPTLLSGHTGSNLLHPSGRTRG